jgi:CDP-glucose 4,6-dehydratase
LSRPDAFWKGRRVLVTGAAGLLGSWVTPALAAAGADVVGLDIAWSRIPRTPHDGLSVVDGDVRELAQLTDVLATPTDAVIHLAAQPIVGEANENPIPTFEHNIAGTWTVLEAARRARVRPTVVVASSDKAYGEGGAAAYEETMPLSPRHPYAASKACCDLLAQTYAASYSLGVVISRCGNLYGGGDINWSRVVPGTIRSVLHGQRPVIRSDGTPVRDYLYVEDVADGMLRLARAIIERPELAGEAFNFGGGDRTSVLEVVERIIALMGRSLEPDVRNEAANEIAEQRVGAEKAQRLLGWAPRHDLDAGLRPTIAWYEEYFQAAQ